MAVICPHCGSQDFQELFDGVPICLSCGRRADEAVAAPAAPEPEPPPEERTEGDG